MDYTIKDLTNEEAAYIGEKINEIVPHEVDADEEEFVLKVENDADEIVGGCIVELYEYGWSRLYLDTLWVDERYRHQGIGSLIIRELERIAREKGCRVVTLGTASYMARPFYEKHGYTVFTTLKMPNGYLSYSLVKYLDRETPEYLPSDNSCARFRISLGNEDDAERIHDGIVAYSEAHEGKFERGQGRELRSGRDRGREQGRLRLCGSAVRGRAAPASGPGHGAFEGGGSLRKGKRRVHGFDKRGRLERRVLPKERLSDPGRAQGRAEGPRLLRAVQNDLKLWRIR